MVVNLEYQVELHFPHSKIQENEKVNNIALNYKKRRYKNNNLMINI